MCRDDKMTTIQEIITDAEGISENTDAMRAAILQITESLQPAIQTAGINFGGSNTWESIPEMDRRTYRIAAGKYRGEWGLYIQYTDAVPEYWDGSNFVGWPDQFDADAEAHGITGYIAYESIKRIHLEETIKKMIEFVDEYADELKRRHMKYADLRKQAEVMAEAIKGQ